MNKKYLIIIIGILLVTLILVIIVTKKKEKEIVNYDFNIHFFNVGKADAILIKNKDKYIMIDTAEEMFSNELLGYFENNNITKLDYLIITHFDKDHVGSASHIIDNIDIENVLQSNYPKDSEYYNNYINSLNNKNIIPNTVLNEYSFNLNDLEVKVTGPNMVYDKNESNNSSLITSIKYKNTKYLFTGDIENQRIKDYVENNKESYDFIKIPYHGNYQKRLNDLLEVVNPKYAVITSSFDDDKTVNLLKELRIKSYNTKNGYIDVYSDGDRISIEQ